MELIISLILICTRLFGLFSRSVQNFCSHFATAWQAFRKLNTCYGTLFLCFDYPPIQCVLFFLIKFYFWIWSIFPPFTCQPIALSVHCLCHWLYLSIKLPIIRWVAICTHQHHLPPHLTPYLITSYTLPPLVVSCYCIIIPSSPH